jgi:hypothetical protein
LVSRGNGVRCSRLRTPSDHVIFTHLAMLVTDRERPARDRRTTRLTAAMRFHTLHGAMNDAMVAQKS